MAWNFGITVVVTVDGRNVSEFDPASEIRNAVGDVHFAKVTEVVRADEIFCRFFHRLADQTEALKSERKVERKRNKIGDKEQEG